MAPDDLPTPEAVRDLLKDTLEGYVAGTEPPLKDPPSAVKPHLDELLKKPSTMRDGLLTLLAYAVAKGAPLDYKTHAKFSSGRAVAQYVANELLPGLKIAGTKDALQTGVKGVQTYYDRANDTWRAVLAWASEQTKVEPIEEAWRYLAAGMAATARDLPPMPSIDTPSLTFGAVFDLLDELLNKPSGGAYEQFIFAAVLEAYLAQLGEQGVVETKNINASDASAGSVADVQHKQRGQVLEAYEVTANDWRTKVAQARGTLEGRDLSRVHILAKKVVEASGADLAKGLPSDVDISVLDIREEIRSVTARLDKFHRRAALERLYSHLVERQSNDQLVKDLVLGLAARKLSEQP